MRYRHVVLALAAVCCLGGRASAGLIYAQSVTSSSGTFGTGSGVPFAGDPVVTLGAPDGNFVQFGFDSSLTLDFGTTSSGPALLQIFTIDDLFAATASVAVSADNNTYSLVAASISDANGTLSGTFHPFATVPVSIPVRYVRITDLGTSPPPFQDLGFDLDAVGLEQQPSVVPEPGGLTLFGLGLLGLAGYLRRCQVARTSC
jgi:hypothetical protein